MKYVPAVLPGVYFPDEKTGRGIYDLLSPDALTGTDQYDRNNRKR